MSLYLSARILAAVLESSSSPAAFVLLLNTGSIARMAPPARPLPKPAACVAWPGEASHD
ncbi:hypothetical protein [Burkholderia sp. BCC1977]|uniref:hypothetical protein n=1 Tax=Burkholderia sp. BCC1977 TaxID=2817440 RepID=UPI002ABDC03E|nr:hypothetical protein [Burkholderia sp. BCC1977]